MSDSNLIKELIPTSLAAEIAAYSPLPADPSIEVAQAKHRINLVNAFASVAPGPAPAPDAGLRILEIGCGQGNCTTVLATAAGPTGAVTALDPAPPTYGAPFTLAQAQAHISASAAGSRISWNNDTTLHQLLARPGLREEQRPWDVAVLVHSSWYFRSPDTLAGILSALRGRVSAVWLAEYAMQASQPAAWPHVLAALARGSLEAHRGLVAGNSDENIQTPLSPDQIKKIAAAAGWDVAGEKILVPEEGLLDGSWEAGTVVGDGFLAELEDAGVQSERVKVVVRSARDATIAAVRAVGGVKKVMTMDVWAVVLRVKE